MSFGQAKSLSEPESFIVMGSCDGLDHYKAGYNIIPREIVVGKKIWMLELSGNSAEEKAPYYLERIGIARN